jgi:hypothetical protein
MRKRAILLCGRKDLCSYADFQVCAHVFQVALSSVHKRVSFGDCWRLLESSGIELTFPSLASQDRIDNRKCYIASQPFVFFSKRGLRCSASLFVVLVLWLAVLLNNSQATQGTVPAVVFCDFRQLWNGLELFGTVWNCYLSFF